MKKDGGRKRFRFISFGPDLLSWTSCFCRSSDPVARSRRPEEVPHRRRRCRTRSEVSVANQPLRRYVIDSCEDRGCLSKVFEHLGRAAPKTDADERQFEFGSGADVPRRIAEGNNRVVRAASGERDAAAEDAFA